MSTAKATAAPSGRICEKKSFIKFKSFHFTSIGKFHSNQIVKISVFLIIKTDLKPY